VTGRKCSSLLKNKKLLCILISNWHRCRMKYEVRKDDSRLLQESNLTARQPWRAPHHVIHLILQTLLPSEWVNLMGCQVCIPCGMRTQFTSTNATDFSDYSTPPPLKTFEHTVVCKWYITDSAEEAQHQEKITPLRKLYRKHSHKLSPSLNLKWHSIQTVKWGLLSLDKALKAGKTKSTGECVS